MPDLAPPLSIPLISSNALVCYALREGVNKKKTINWKLTVGGGGVLTPSLYKIMYNPCSLDVDVEIGTVAYNTDSYVGAFNRSTGTNIIGELDFNRGLNGNIKVE